MSDAGVYSGTNLFNLININYHSAIYTVGSNLIKVGGNVASGGWLYSKTPISNPTGSTRYAQADYAELSGHSMANVASVLMPDNRILIFPVRTSDMQCRPMILDTSANTLTSTGHSITVTSSTIYDFRIGWSTTYNCAIWITDRMSGTRAYAYRPF